MANQWYAAKNVENKYDQIGYAFSNVVTNSGCCVKLQGQEMTFAQISDIFPWENLGAVAFDQSNYFRDAIAHQAFIKLSNEARTEFINLMDDLALLEAETDYSVIKAEITTWETAVGGGTLNENEKFQLLGAASLLRYAILIYLPMGNEPSSTLSLALAGVWKWLAFAACVAISIFLVAPIVTGALTVGGYVFYGIVGGLVGWRVMELDIFN